MMVGNNELVPNSPAKDLKTQTVESFIDRQRLPRLLYIGDTPVDATTGGSALLYRLFQEYPQSKLHIVEGSIWKSDLDKRLENVKYETVRSGSRRFIHSRFSRLYQSILLISASKRSFSLKQQIEKIHADAIVSVAHGFLWLTAAALAKQMGRPFHLIVHDDWISLTQFLNFLKPYETYYFGSVYRQAASRLCICPYMAEHYESLYGASGEVIYPSRARDSVEFATPPTRLSENQESIVVAYAGSLHIQGYLDMLSRLAAELEPRGGQLIIFSPLDKETISQYKLDRSNVIVRNVIPYKQLIQELREKVDVLFVPMSFEPQWEMHMKLSFPSKLADYSAIGVPLLIWGPPYCSAVRWARENPGVAEVIESNQTEALVHAIERLTNYPERRMALALNVIRMSSRFFSHQAVTEQFFVNIIQSTHPDLATQ